MQRHDSRCTPHSHNGDGGIRVGRMRLSRQVTDKLSLQVIGRPELETNRRVWLYRGSRLREDRDEAESLVEGLERTRPYSSSGQLQYLRSL
jgi:hypothetical protein